MCIVSLVVVHKIDIMFQRKLLISETIVPRIVMNMF